MNSSDNSCDTSTSYDFTDNPTRDALVEGLMAFLKPNIDRLDETIEAARSSQINLQNQLEMLSKDIHEITISQKDLSTDLQPYTETVANIRYKFTVISNILQSAHDRLRNLFNEVDSIKENNKTHFNESGKSGLFSAVE